MALAQDSTQYSPRVLRNLTRDRANQVVLGFFLGVFAYCLILLRNVSWEKSSENPFPSLAIFVAFFLALAAMGFLIFFIHLVRQPAYRPGIHKTGFKTGLRDDA